ncbi:alpha/beta hydrolase [Croceivirga thetidis]|uniref:Alpha/beta hydrolase n=1 Tax=Croceivirga thetidis TaxID=2721623 RepID=A0ABX1GPH6_9FLAO|nr:alpha/beta hydrolase [Croceivirga thetidis]NKI31820.1 alpha/beta hydrolase [Croceivirga thetidis]
MKQLLFFVLLLLFSCNTDDGVTASTENSEGENTTGAPTVQANATYTVSVTENIEYARGLSHTSINSAETTSVPLYLDAYTPVDAGPNRPILMLIHGGGFIGGSKQGVMASLAQYFAERGWVVFSIAYRLQADLGTIPQEWEAYGDLVDAEFLDQFFAIYPAHRDAKAAMRWIVANAASYDINLDYITVGGGSAGAITAIGISVSEDGDYTTEISSTLDETLNTTNLGESYEVKTILDFWGSDISVFALEEIYGFQRFDANSPALFIAHGTEDPTVLFEEALKLRDIYEANQAPYVFYELTGLGHSAWNATVEGKRLEALALDYMVEQQSLLLE